MFLYICKIFVWLPLLFLFPTKIKGRKNMPKGKAVIVSNHTSNMDIVLLISNTWEKKYILAKKELFKNKFLGGVLKSFGGIGIDRYNPDISAIKKCLKLLSNNKKLVIFPEGTRNKSGDFSKMGEVKTGTAMIAIKSKSPIIPMWISRKPKLFRMTNISIGKPFELSQFYDIKLTDEVLQNATKIIIEKMEELR